MVKVYIAAAFIQHNILVCTMEKVHCCDILFQNERMLHPIPNLKLRHCRFLIFNSDKFNFYNCLHLAIDNFTSLQTQLALDWIG